MFLLLTPALLFLTALAGVGFLRVMGVVEKLDPGELHHPVVRWSSALALAFTAGAAGLCFLFAVLGHLVLNGTMMTLLALVPAAWGGWGLWSGAVPLPAREKSERAPLTLLERLILAAISVSALLGFLGAMSPEVRHDPLFYHVQVPQLWLNFGRMVHLPENGHSYFPYGYEMLYTWGLALESDSIAKAFHWAAGLAGAAWVARLASHFRATPIAAAGLYYFIPTMIYLSTTTYIDLATGMYALAAVTLLWEEMASRPALRTVLLVGFFTGSAMSTKYTAWPLVGVPMGFAVLLSRPGWGPLLRCGVVTLLPVAPWSGRNLVYTGNPLAPLMISVFGPESAKGGELHGYFDSFAGQAHGVAAAFTAPIGYARHLILQKYTISLLGLLAAVALVSIQLSRRGPLRTPATGLLALLAFMFWCEAFFTRGHPDGRYGLVSMGLGAVAVAMLCARLATLGGARACMLAPVLALAMAASALLDYPRQQRMMQERWLPIISREARLDYRIQKKTVPPDFAELEAWLLAADAGRVTGISYPSHTRYWNWILGLRPEALQEIAGEDAPPEAIRTGLETLGFTHFVNGENPGLAPGAWFEFLETLEKREFSGGSTVFALENP